MLFALRAQTLRVMCEIGPRLAMQHRRQRAPLSDVAPTSLGSFHSSET